ncbi:MAG: Fic family protein [Acidimicrobiales bacterium]|nr:Fic family protein [Acidimicrobiales bacterium]
MAAIADSRADGRDRRPGREVPIEWRARPARAWVPALLSSRDLEVRAATARRTGEALANLRTLATARASVWEPTARLLLRAEGVASSSIEGLRAPAAEVAAAELDAAAVDDASAWVADNLAVVTEALGTATAGPLGVARLHAWHRRLMRHSRLAPEMVGAFRGAQGWVGGTSPLDAAYVPPPPEHVPALMEDLVRFANSRSPDPITQAAAVHAQFETIHPYGDGNGRIGRVLVAWVLSRRTGIPVPPPVSVLIAHDVGGYLSGLYQFRTGDIDPFVGWFAGIVTRSADATAAAVASLEALLEAWRGRLEELRADALALRLLDLLPAHPVVTSTIVAEEAKVTERTARRALSTLGQHGILSPFQPTPRGPGRPHQWWVATELLRVVGD